MSIPLRLIDPPLAGTTVQPGDCWYCTAHEEAWCELPNGGPDGSPWRPIHIPDIHCRSGARPMMVMLPGGILHCLHTSPSRRPDDGWTVTGELPGVTVTPSIDTGIWHGFIINGALVDA